ncbi:MAG TPA: response regulator [Terriglobales bacterium]|nr:response regulator [Terriglobales bacterium]
MSRAAAPKAKKILVVDDEAPLRRILTKALDRAGMSVTTAEDGKEALAQLKKKKFDVMLLDVWMPKMNGLEVLSQLRTRAVKPRVVVMTGDNRPETLLTAVREQVYQCIAKPFSALDVVTVVAKAAAMPEDAPGIEVLSARPDWVELSLPCERESAERIHEFMQQLKSDLPQETRTNVGQAFRELLLNAVEWGGKLDPSLRVRISYLRTKRMLLYRISDPGAGFKFEELDHAACCNPPGDPVHHMEIREAKGLRAGGFGLLLTRSIVDELLYNEQQNEVVFIKYLD